MCHKTGLGVALIGNTNPNTNSIYIFAARWNYIKQYVPVEIKVFFLLIKINKNKMVSSGNDGISDGRIKPTGLYNQE